MKILEVCIDSLESARNALKAGADRLEVCSSLNEGGLTPSAGLLKAIKSEFPAAITFVMLRCRPGADFCYSQDDVQTMLYDLDILKSLGANGFVFGALDGLGNVDIQLCTKILETAFPLPVTFHRAFDACINPFKSLEDIIKIGYSRILTSGQSKSAVSPKAITLLQKLLLQSSGRIIILAGAGIDETNVQELRAIGISEVHGSFKSRKCIEISKFGDVSIGRANDDILFVTNADMVSKTAVAFKS